MNIFHNFDRPGNYLKNIVISIGNFDGIHLGHQKILKELIQEAAMCEGTPLVLTFIPHPLTILAPEKSPPLLTRIKDRLLLIQKYGIDNILLINFDKRFSEITPEIFIKDYLVNQLRIKKIVIGQNYFFGRNKQGNIDFLKKYAKVYNFNVKVVLPFIIDNQILSSSKIRFFIKNGDLENAKKYLGRDYFIRGKVVSGESRGRTIDIPTANLQELPVLLPPCGVYYTKVIYKEKEYRGATNIGIRPTFGDNQNKIVETHILDFNEFLYHQEITIRFIKKIRDEIKFSSIEELKAQVKRDIEKIKQI
ncbi:MAG: bifunctional riboflavin kinase/FAD synthetase [Candidatus Firestonebacteria bacterium]|nr:bifunctional riboflavin kinase/FAD synthetase [Candidatus Firestonebacteria bacterium]